MVKPSTLEIVMVSMDNIDDFRKSFASILGLLSAQCRVVVVDSSSTPEIFEESSLLIKSGKNIYYTWEKPKGIYHAMNSAIKLCSDDSLVWFLNPGDVVTNTSLIVELVQLIDQNERKWGYGLASYDNASSNSPSIFPAIVENTVQSLFHDELQISHQSMLVSKEVLVELEMFNPKFRIAADLNFQFNLIARYTPQILLKHLVIIDTNGVSHKQQVTTLVESFRIRLLREEFSLSEKMCWLLTTLVRRLKSTKRFGL
jgi:glycosyltransferase involved in cell wall biosynthesis